MSLCGLHVSLYSRCAVTLLHRLLYILQPVLAKPNYIKSYLTDPNLAKPYQIVQTIQHQHHCHKVVDHKQAMLCGLLGKLPQGLHSHQGSDRTQV